MRVPVTGKMNDVGTVLKECLQQISTTNCQFGNELKSIAITARE